MKKTKRTFYRAKFKAEVSCFQNQRERMEPHYRKPLVHPFHLLFFFSPPLPISSSSKIWRWWLTSRDSNRAQFWRFRGCIFLPLPPLLSLFITAVRSSNPILPLVKSAIYATVPDRLCRWAWNLDHLVTFQICERSAKGRRKKKGGNVRQMNVKKEKIYIFM